MYEKSIFEELEYQVASSKNFMCKHCGGEAHAYRNVIFCFDCKKKEKVLWR